MEHSPFKTGLSFGLTSGVITTLGLIVGLHSGTHSKVAVMGGILTIAIADTFSDALGVHISQESQENVSERDVWIATASTFFFKLLFATSFMLPLLVLPFSKAILVDIIWGFSLLSAYSYVLAKNRGESPIRIVFEHVSIGAIVVMITHILGDWLSHVFV
jgi:vacuolar iron transporter family protein